MLPLGLPAWANLRRRFWPVERGRAGARHTVEAAGLVCAARLCRGTGIESESSGYFCEKACRALDFSHSTWSENLDGVSYKDMFFLLAAWAK